ncbi:MAG: hypothetical protein OHK0057_16820 [Thermoflexibacter sp.]
MKKKLPVSRLSCIVLISLFIFNNAFGQTAITAATVNTNTQASTSSSYSIAGAGTMTYPSATTYTLEYGNLATTETATRNLISFQIGAANYNRVSGPDQVNLTRETPTTCPGMNTCCLASDGCIDRLISYYELVSSTGTTRVFNPPYTINPTVFFGGTVLNRGADNVFVNRNDANLNNNDIERIDYIFKNGLSAADVTKAGFVIFDRGTGDPCKIKAISSINASNLPTGYYDADPVTTGSQAVAIAAANFTSIDLGSSLNFLVVRKESTANSAPATNISGQAVRGTFISFAALGIANSQVVYGYSLVANDVGVSDDFLSTAAFSKATDNMTGGLDLSGVSGAWAEEGSTITILPLHLVSFEAVSRNCKTQLIWKTVQESQIKFFEVEESTNGADFQTIGKVEAKNQLSNAYAFDVQKPLKQAYHRLRVVEEDEEPHYSAMIFTRNQCGKSASTVSIFPNPTENFITCLLHTEVNVLSCEIEIYNQFGKLVHKKNDVSIHQNQAQLDITHLPAGNYIIHFISSEHTSTTKFIKH